MFGGTAMSDAERYHRLAEEYRNQATQERELTEQLRLLKVAHTFDNFSAQALQRSAGGRQQEARPAESSNAEGAKTRP